MQCRPTPEWHGFAMQDTRALPSTGFRRRCAAWRVTFLCVAKEKSPKERPPPLVRPPASGSLGSPVCPTARADGPSLALRRSLGILPRGLDKRAHLGEQQGATRDPETPRPDCLTDAISEISLVPWVKSEFEYSNKQHTALLGHGLIFKTR